MIKTTADIGKRGKQYIGALPHDRNDQDDSGDEQAVLREGDHAAGQERVLPQRMQIISALHCERVHATSTSTPCLRDIPKFRQHFEESVVNRQEMAVWVVATNPAYASSSDSSFSHRHRCL